MSKPWPGPVTAHWGAPGDATSPWRLVLRCRWGDGVPLVLNRVLRAHGIDPESPTAAHDLDLRLRMICRSYLALDAEEEK